MYEKFFGQAETLFKPFNDLISTNQSALEVLANRQTNLLTEIWQDGVAHVQKIAEVTDGNYLDIQKAYWERLQEKLTEATQTSVDYIAATQSKLTDLFQDSLLSASLADTLKPGVFETSPAAPVKPTTVKPAAKVAAEPAPTAKPVAKTKAESSVAKAKPTAKTATKKVGGDEASVEKAIRSIMSERN